MSEYSMRSHPMLKGTTPLNSINVGITTHCSMTCPNCSIDIPRIKDKGRAKHCTLTDLYRDGRHMQNLMRIHVTGGEPTMHPEFVQVVNTLAGLWNPKYITLETNGAGYVKYREFIGSAFHLVFMTHYKRNAVYPGNQDNTHLVEMAEKDLGDKFVREAPVRHTSKHTEPLPISLRYYGAPEEPCSKFYDPGLASGWYDGLLYHCCVGIGVDPTMGIPVTENWREELSRQPLGCATCCYRGT